MIGDLNSRTGRKPDYIVDDPILTDIEDDFSPDTPVQRHSADNGCNRFGDCLLDLRKSIGFRIVNGRLFIDTHKMTCYTSNGESLVDYVVTSQQNFSEFCDFKIHDFNEFSNHAAISFSLKISTQRSGKADPIYKNIYTWNEILKDEFVNILNQDMFLLNEMLLENQNVEENVIFFSNFLTSRANQYFEKHIKVKQGFKFV